MGRLLTLLLVAAVAAAGEPDGAVAAAARWTGPRGPASGSCRSRARPVVTEIEEAWRIDLKDIAAPPVHWDGRGYVIGSDGKKPVLVAFDLRTGRELARTKLRGYVAGSGLSVWDHMVFVQPEGNQINGYRLERSKLKLVWIFRGRKYEDGWRRPHLPVVHDNEVYCFFGDGWLARLTPGSKFPAWVTPLDASLRYASRPVVYGPYVFFAAFDESGFRANAPGNPQVHGKTITELRLFAYRRRDGKLAGRRKVCQAMLDPRVEPEPSLMIAGNIVYIGSRWKLPSSEGTASHVMVPLTLRDVGVTLSGDVGLWSFRVPPAHHPRLGAVALSVVDGKLEWRLHRDRQLALLTRKAVQPDLFKDRVTPTVLGDVVYFGSWAADLETREILWRLPVADVSFSVVPADGLFLVVERRSVLRAFRGRGKR